MPIAGRRLLVYDRTCVPGLSHTWWAGARLYRALGRVDAHRGATSWTDALGWLAIAAPGAPIVEIQFWGHGKWGRALIGDDILDAGALRAGHPLHQRLRQVRARLAPDALWWFRTCETFGARSGHEFAAAWTDFLGCRAAGHTYVIGVLQSGLHQLRPGARPGWSREEGLAAGTADAPVEALSSRRGAPNTITCFTGSIPARLK